MSFSSDVKVELGDVISSGRHCQIAEFAAVFSACGRVKTRRNGKIWLEIHTENLTVIRKSYILIRTAFQARPEIRIRNHGSGSMSYSIIVTEPKDVISILKAIKIMDESGDRWGDLLSVPSRLVQNTCCKRAYLRGIFMVTGSVTNPEKAYHLEICVSHLSYARQLQELVSSFAIEAKIVERKRYYILYIKEGSLIVDFLNVIEAHLALMKFENVRILKEVRNSVNRQVNCETANIQKTVTAAAKQIEDIQYIEKHKGFSGLNDGLREIAELRLDYPDASLADLGMMLSRPLGKSGVNHRLRKLSDIAQSIREQNGDIPDPKEDKLT